MNQQVATTENQILPTKPCMTDLLRRLVACVRARGVGHLPTIGPVTRREAREYLAAMESWMKPADTNRTMARIAVLLAHYWTPNMPSNLQEAVAMDWGESLKDLPWNVVEATAREWVKTQERRPTPAAFLKLSKQFIDRDAEDCKLLRHVLRKGWTEAGKHSEGAVNRDLRGVT